MVPVERVSLVCSLVWLKSRFYGISSQFRIKSLGVEQAQFLYLCKAVLGVFEADLEGDLNFCLYELGRQKTQDPNEGGLWVWIPLQQSCTAWWEVHCVLIQVTLWEGGHHSAWVHVQPHSLLHEVFAKLEFLCFPDMTRERGAEITPSHDVCLPETV